MLCRLSETATEERAAGILRFSFRMKKGPRRGPSPLLDTIETIAALNYFGRIIIVWKNGVKKIEKRPRQRYNVLYFVRLSSL